MIALKAARIKNIISYESNVDWLSNKLVPGGSGYSNRR